MAEQNHQTINQILELDAKNRYLGVKDDLFTLDTLKKDSSWHYDLPTLVEFASEYNTTTCLRDITEFTDKFYKKYRIFNKVNLDNIFIAGGAIRSILLDKNAKDIDLFVYGLKTQEQATKRVEKLLIELYENIEKIKTGFYVKKEDNEKVNTKDKRKKKVRRETSDSESDEDTPKRRRKTKKTDVDTSNKHLFDEYIKSEFQVIYNGNTLTLLVDKIKIQIILRLYSTPSEILHGFDLGSSSVGFDGKNVYFTTLSKFCYENMVNIFDGTRRSTTYENRLIKYFKIGFNIILPNLNLGKLSVKYFKYKMHEVCELPYMTFSYSNINGNIVHVDKFFTKGANEVDTDYDFYDIDASNKHKMKTYNLKQLVSQSNKFLYIVDLHEDICVYKSKNQDLSKWTLNFTDGLFKYDYVEDIYKSNYNKLSHNKIELQIIREYITVIKPADFINTVYLADLTKDEKLKRLDDIFLKQKQWIKDALKTLKVDTTIKWMTENPTTQLTSSFNPIIEDPKQWYGELFIAKI